MEFGSDRMVGGGKEDRGRKKVKAKGASFSLSLSLSLIDHRPHIFGNFSPFTPTRGRRDVREWKGAISREREAEEAEEEEEEETVWLPFPAAPTPNSPESSYKRSGLDKSATDTNERQIDRQAGGGRAGNLPDWVGSCGRNATSHRRLLV